MNPWNRLREVLRRVRFRRDLRLFLQCLRKRTCDETLPADLAARLADMSGWLTPREAALLYRFARTWPLQGPVIELGSFAGKSAAVFASAGRRVFAVDAWSRDTLVYAVSVDDGGRAPVTDAAPNAFEPDDIWRQFQDNMKEELRTQRVVPMRGKTREVAASWTQPCALLYVDASHEYEDVRADLDLWSRFVLPGGALLMHDVFTYHGVTRAANELLRRGWRVAGFAGRLAAFVRVDEGSG